MLNIAKALPQNGFSDLRISWAVAHLAKNNKTERFYGAREKGALPKTLWLGAFDHFQHFFDHYQVKAPRQNAFYGTRES